MKTFSCIDNRDNYLGDIPYVSKENFDHGNVVGCIINKEAKSRNGDYNGMLLVKGKLYGICSVGSINGNTVGYVDIGDNYYLALVKKNNKKSLIIVILTVLLLALGTAGAFYFLNKKSDVIDNKPGLEFEDDKAAQANAYPQDANVDSIEIPGYANLYVSKDHPTVNLNNPEKNTSYFIYQILEGDKVLYETKAIKPGNMAEVDLYSLLTPGEHTIVLNISTYDVLTQAVGNGTTNEVNITVEQ